MIDKNRLVKTTQDLIKIPSISGNENTISNFVAENLEDAGFKPETDEVGNIYVVFGKGKKSLMLNAHLDTVPPEGYKNDPYSGLVRKDKIYGLGASDCKSGVAVMMEVLKSVSEPEGKLILAFTVCEESVLKGSRLQKGSMYAAEKYGADGCVVLEPTLDKGQPSIACGCRGRTIINMRVSGKSTHSSRPETGVNAIDESFRLFKELKKQNLKTKTYFSQPLHETLSLVKIDGGSSATNIIPGTCEVIVDYRTLPGRKDAINNIRKIVENSGVSAKINVPYSSPGCVLEENDPFIDVVESAVEQEFKTKPRLMVALGRADSEYFYRKGTPALIFGPGENAQCHKPDEYVTIPGMVKCAESVVRISEEFLS